MIVVLAPGYQPLMGVGPPALRSGRPGAWSSNKRPDSANCLLMGQGVLATVDLGPPLVSAATDQLQRPVPNRG